MNWWIYIILALAFTACEGKEGISRNSQENAAVSGTLSSGDSPKNALGIANLPSEKVYEVKQVIQHFIESKEPGEKYHIDDRKLYSSEVLPRAYMENVFSPLWLTVQGDSLIKAAQMLQYMDEIEYHGFTKYDYHYTPIKTLYHKLAHKNNTEASAVDLAYLDIYLTDAFLLLSSHLYNGKYDPESMEIQYGIQRGKPELKLDHKLFKMLSYDEVNDFMPIFYPKSHGYENMVAKAKSLKDKINKDFTISLPRNYDFGSIFKDTIMRARILEKLYLLEYIKDSSVIATIDSTDFSTVIKMFQFNHGLNCDGEIGAHTFEAINTPLKDRLYQLYVNMERLRWLPEKENEYRVVVNIADYTMDLLDGRDTLIHMRTIVGRNFRRTPVFDAKMTYLVFSPTWTVPPGILRNDVLPAVAKDVGYLAKNNMIIIDRSGSTVSPSAIDWQKARTGSFPYTIRQQPGDNNALGRVKFMFPNRHSVYLHDTPAKNLFERDERMFSSGCIRIEKPFELARILLNDSLNWGNEQIRAAMSRNTEQTVVLRRPVNVYIYYLTAWGGDHFRKDVYGRDESKKKLFFP
jgi:murein L,D-transpeptidase YcbB/YkuD